MFKKYWWIILLGLALIGLIILFLPKYQTIQYKIPSTINITNTTTYNVDTMVFIAVNKVMGIDSLKVNILYNDRYFKYNRDIKAVLYQNNPKDYNLFINRTVSNREIEVIIAHEMIHLKQYYDGILIQKSLTDSIVYNGIKFSPTTSYNERPWERDAYTNQDIMLAKIKDLMYEKKN